MIWWSFLMAYNVLALMLFYIQYVCWITQNTCMALNNNIVHPKKRNQYDITNEYLFYDGFHRVLLKRYRLRGRLFRRFL